MPNTASDLAHRLAENAEAVCRHYLPNGKRAGRYWLIGDVDNSPGRSLYVRLIGTGTGRGAAGKWTDAATGEHGDLLDLIAGRQRLTTLGDTLDEARHFLSLPSSVRFDDRRRESVPTGSPEAARRLLAMSTPIAGTLAETYLRNRGIRETTGLTASAGVSYNKFVAKLASDQNKPDGMCVIRPAQGPAFVAALPVKRFHGVGRVTAAKMAGLGIITGADLRDFGLDALSRHFGSSASYFHRAAHGDDDRPVRPDRQPKSVGAERTFDRDLVEEPDLLAALEPVVDAAWRRIERAEVSGRTLTLKVKFADFSLISRATTRPLPIATRDNVIEIGTALLRRMLPVDQGIRLLGLTLSGFGQDLTSSDIAELSLPLT